MQALFVQSESCKLTVHNNASSVCCAQCQIIPVLRNCDVTTWCASERNLRLCQTKMHSCMSQPDTVTSIALFDTSKSYILHWTFLWRRHWGWPTCTKDLKICNATLYVGIQLVQLRCILREVYCWLQLWFSYSIESGVNPVAQAL